MDEDVLSLTAGSDGSPEDRENISLPGKSVPRGSRPHSPKQAVPLRGSQPHPSPPSVALPEAEHSTTGASTPRPVLGELHGPFNRLSLGATTRAGVGRGRPLGTLGETAAAVTTAAAPAELHLRGWASEEEFDLGFLEQDPEVSVRLGRVLPGNGGNFTCLYT